MLSCAASFWIVRSGSMDRELQCFLLSCILTGTACTSMDRGAFLPGSYPLDGAGDLSVPSLTLIDSIKLEVCFWYLRHSNLQICIMREMKSAVMLMNETVWRRKSFSLPQASNEWHSALSYCAYQSQQTSRLWSQPCWSFANYIVDRKRMLSKHSHPFSVSYGPYYGIVDTDSRSKYTSPQQVNIR